MVRIEDFSLLLRDLYAATAEPAQWSRFLESTKNAIGASACGVLVRDERRGSIGHHALSIGLDPKYIRAYNEYYSSINIVYDAALAIDPDNYIGTLQHCVDLKTYRHSEIYNDYARPQNLFYQCCALLTRKGKYAAAISFMRPENDGAYGSRHVRLLRQLAPHMRQAFQMHNMLRGLENSVGGLSAALDRFDTATFLLDGARRLRRTNAAGQRLLAAGDALLLRDGQLTPRRQEDCANFDRLIGNACETGAGRGVSAGGGMLLHRSAGRALYLKAVPFHSESAFLDSAPSAIVFVQVPETAPASRGEVLRSLYGLSPAEAQLADLLLAGVTIASAAEKRRTTAESARTQLKSILRKTETNRQSELIRLLMHLPA